MGASDPDPGGLPEITTTAGSRLSVAFIHRDVRWREAMDEAQLSCAADMAYVAALPDGAGAEVSLLLSDDDEIRTLNRNWRGKDEATNVLSFPLDAPHAGDGPPPLGDIALAYETVMREAAHRELQPGQHAAHLVVHGVLHLLGYDHMSEAQARAMEALEIEVLGRMGIANPYAPEPAMAGEEK